MFTSFIARLRSEIETIKRVLTAHDSIRALIFSASQQEEAVKGAELGAPDQARNDGCLQVVASIRLIGPTKSSWQVYDHCAAFTRIYAVYESFVSELASDYIRILPSLYPRYEDLPESVAKQHRVGIAQILLKLGKDSPYKHLGEIQVVGDLAQGLAGAGNYKLLPDAFLIDPQNYKPYVVDRIFGYLGISKCWAWVEKHPPLASFMESYRDPTETPGTILHDLVEYRNEAAHTSVAETVAIEEIKSIADCVVLICEALAQLVMRQVVRRMEELGKVAIVGDVIRAFSNGVVGVQMRAGLIGVGDELVIFHKKACQMARVLSIRTGANAHEQLESGDDQQIGLRLDVSAREGARLLRILDETGSRVSVGISAEPIAPDTEVAVEAQDSDLDAE